MSENFCKALMIIPQTELPPNSTVPEVERVPVFTDSRGVVHYHERAKPVESTQIVMRATHYRHWMPLSDRQLWEAMYPPEMTDDELAAVHKYGKGAFLRLLGFAFIIFVLLCIATTDNVLRSGVIQLAATIADTVNPPVKMHFARPLRIAITAVLEALTPAYQFGVEVAVFVGWVCSELWQVAKPILSAIGVFIRTWSTPLMKEWGTHIATAWEEPIRFARRYPGEVFLYTLPNKLNCFGKYRWITIILDTAFLVSFAWVLPYRIARYVVVFAKILFFALPLLYISPYDRLAFWPALSVLVVLEVYIAIVLFWVYGWGHVWGVKARFTVYRTWEKHFKYTRQTFDSYDRMIWLSRIYPLFKIGLFMDQLCSNKFVIEQPSSIFMYEQRLRYPHVGTNAFADKTFPVGYKTPQQYAAEAAIEALDQAARDKRAIFWMNYKKRHEFYVQVARDHFARAEEMWYAREGKIHNLLTDAYNKDLLDDETVLKARLMLRPKPILKDYLEYYVSRNNAVYKQAIYYYNYVWRLPSQIKAQPQLKPKTHSKASLLPDYDYFTTLVEQDTAVNLKYGLLFILALSSLTVYSIILAGWSSNSKYAFIGALRSAAQMISYEVAISLILLPVVLLAGSLNITMVVYMQSITIWFLFPLLPAAILFIIAMLAETNRTPFDLPEAEAELVAGYNVDYSALPFAMFFLGEYCNMILISVLFCLLFLGGWSLFGYYGVIILVVKAIMVWFYFIHVRATLPRYRYDQLMDNGWKIFLPIAGGFFIFIVGVLVGLDALPVTTELPLQEISRFTAASCAVATHGLSAGVRRSTTHTRTLASTPSVFHKCYQSRPQQFQSVAWNIK